MKTQRLAALVDRQKLLFEEKSKNQEQGFAITTLQDGKQSALLFRLGDNVQKKDFKSLDYQDGRLLNSLCKIFAISHPYSAICLIENKVYISLSQTKSINLHKIIEVTNKLINCDLKSNACIPIVAQFYEILSKENNQYVKRILDQKFIAYSKIDKPNCDIYTYAARDERLFLKFFKIEDIQNIQKLFRNKLEFEQIIPSQEELHIHVELNLIAKIIEKQVTDNFELSIGLASSNIMDKVGLCGYCTAAANAIMQVLSINITRSADFPQNIPNGHWDFPYKLLNTLEKNYWFFHKILEQYKVIVERNLGNNEAYILLMEKLDQFKYIEDIIKINTELEEINTEIHSIFENLSMNDSTVSDDLETAGNVV